MSIVATSVRAEDFLVQINGDYNVLFETVSVTVAGALAAGTVLKDAATAAVAEDTASIGILAEAKAAGTQFCRVVVRGNPTLIDSAKLSVTSATIQAALEAKGLIYVK
jgi:hypothetical protein